MRNNPILPKFIFWHDYEGAETLAVFRRIEEERVGF